MMIMMLLMMTKTMMNIMMTAVMMMAVTLMAITMINDPDNHAECGQHLPGGLSPMTTTKSIRVDVITDRLQNSWHPSKARS